MAEGFALSRAFVEVGANTLGAEERIKGVRKDLYDLVRKTYDAKIGADDEAGQYKLARFKQALDRFDRFTAEATVDVDADKAELRLLALQATLQRIEKTSVTAHVDVNVDVDRGAFTWMQRAFAALTSAGQNALQVLGHIPGIMGGIAESLAASGPAGLAAAAGLIAVAGAATLAAAALGPIVAALLPITVGFIGLGAAAAPVIKHLVDFFSATNAKAARQAWAAMDPGERNLARHIDRLKESFSGLFKQVRPKILDAFNTALDILKEAMPALKPLINAAADAVKGFLHHLLDWLKSPSGQKFLNWLSTEGPNDIRAFGKVLWNVTRVIGTAFFLWRKYGGIAQDALLLVFRLIELAAWSTVEGILNAFSLIPGVGVVFKEARDTAQRHMESMVKSVADATRRIQNDWDSLHGRNIALTWSLHLPPGVHATAAFQQKRTKFGASGMLVPGSGSGDTVPAMLTPGEVVVPKGMVQAGMVDHLRGQLPGFAQGGLVGGGFNIHAQFQPPLGAALAAFNQAFYAEQNAIAKWVRQHIVVPAFRDMPSGVGAPGGPGSHASLPWLEHLWIAAGGPPGVAHLMAAIAMAESGGSPIAHNPSGASGLWQILGLPFPGNPFDPMTNARMAVAKYRSQGLGAWEAYTNGMYRAFYAKGGLVNTYDNGGLLPPGVSVAVNNTGSPEAVIPMAKGGLVDQIHHAERIIRHHPEGSRRWSNLTDKLSAVNDRIHDNRQLARFLHGGQLEHVKDSIREDERIRRRLLRELRPVRHQRHVVQQVAWLLHAQERALAAAIRLAQHRHITGAVQRMEGLLHRDKNLRGWMNWWLDKRWWTPTGAQRRRDDRHADDIIRDAIRTVGLPLVSFDQGGVLPPGVTMAVNNTGRPERVGGPVEVVGELKWKRGSINDAVIDNWLLKHIQGIVRTRGGGSSATAFDQQY
jgi:hypothetical protein